MHFGHAPPNPILSPSITISSPYFPFSSLPKFMTFGFDL